MFVVYYKSKGHPRKYLGISGLVSRLQYAAAMPESWRHEFEAAGHKTQSIQCSPVADAMYSGPVPVNKISW